MSHTVVSKLPDAPLQTQLPTGTEEAWDTPAASEEAFAPPADEADYDDADAPWDSLNGDGAATQALEFLGDLDAEDDPEFGLAIDAEGGDAFEEDLDLVVRAAQLSMEDSDTFNLDEFDDIEDFGADDPDPTAFFHEDADRQPDSEDGEEQAASPDPKAGGYLQLQNGRWGHERAEQLLTKLLNLEKPVVTTYMTRALEQELWCLNLVSFITRVPPNAAALPLCAEGPSEPDGEQGELPLPPLIATLPSLRFLRRPESVDDLNQAVVFGYRATILFMSMEQNSAMKEVVEKKAVDIVAALLRGFWPSSCSVLHHVCGALTAILRCFPEKFYRGVLGAADGPPDLTKLTFESPRSVASQQLPASGVSSSESGKQSTATAAADGADATGADEDPPSQCSGESSGGEAKEQGSGAGASKPSETENQEILTRLAEAGIDAHVCNVALHIGPMIQCLHKVPVLETFLNIIVPEEPPLSIEGNELGDDHGTGIAGMYERDADYENVRWSFNTALSKFRLVERLVAGVCIDINSLDPYSADPIFPFPGIVAMSGVQAISDESKAIEEERALGLQHAIACSEALLGLLERLAQSPSGEILLTPFGYVPAIIDDLVRTLVGRNATGPSETPEQQRVAAGEVLYYLCQSGAEETMTVHWRPLNAAIPEPVLVRNNLFEVSKKFRAHLATRCESLCRMLALSAGAESAGGKEPGTRAEDAWAPEEIPAGLSFCHPGWDERDVKDAPPAFSHLRLLTVGIIAELVTREQVSLQVPDQCWIRLAEWLFLYPDNNLYHRHFFSLFFAALRKNQEKALKTLMERGNLANKLLEAFDGEKKAAGGADAAGAAGKRRRLGNRGFLLKIANCLRLQAETLHPDSYLRHYLSTHPDWVAFQDQLLDETKQQQLQGMGKPVPEPFSMDACAGGGYMYGDIDFKYGNEVEPVVETSAEAVDVGLGSAFAISLGFEGATAWQPSAAGGGGKKKRKKRAKRKQGGKGNFDADIAEGLEDYDSLEHFASGEENEGDGDNWPGSFDDDESAEDGVAGEGGVLTEFEQ